MASRLQIVVDLDADVNNALLEAASTENRPASEIVRDLIVNYVAENDDPEYWDYVAKKVDAARRSMREGRGISNAEVEAEFAARRSALMQKND